jgi:AAA+ superfamily predicted ATPase
MDMKHLIIEALKLPTNAIAYYMSQQLSTFYSNKACIEGSDCSFDLEGYVAENDCTLKKHVVVHNQIKTGWNGTKIQAYERAENVFFEVNWQGQQLDVLLMSWAEGWSHTTYYWILADVESIASNFFADVCKWSGEIEDEVLVFEDGSWSKSQTLYQAIKDATFDNLVLPEALKQDLETDLVNFFASESTYQTYGVPWKRGVLLIGPPGNGKTHAIKALINTLGQPCLYVKSFKDKYGTESENIHQVFIRARQSAPCILVLEDLDSLVNDENRSFFLNELDGFAVNTGIVTLATTNHPDRLDEAILERPSRFDRKYYFHLPGHAEREAYLHLWNRKLQPGMQITDSTVNQLADFTDGFSFAYIKELFLSTMMEWMQNKVPEIMGSMLIGQVKKLREQIEQAKLKSEKGKYEL